MRISLAVLVVITVLSTSRPGTAQPPAKSAQPQGAPQAAPAKPAPQTVAPAQPAPAAPAPPPKPLPSTLMQPALDLLRGTLSGVRTEKWKRGSVRDEASGDISSILGELDSNMPQLLRDADAAPDTLSKALPLSRHVNALYDTFLRVFDAARISAPSDQVDLIQNSLKELSGAPPSLDERLMDAASAQEKQIVDLRATVQKQASFKCPAPPPPAAPACPAPAPPRKPRKKPATPAKPAPTQQISPSQPAAPAKPS
jgi:hypothetical protein